MTTLRALAGEISLYLVDQERGYEFTHWTEDDILDYARDALRIVALNLKSEFVRVETVDLRPGTLQELPSGCSEFVSVVGNVDKYGTVVDLVGRSSLRALQQLQRPVCDRSDKGPGYKVSSYQFDVANARNFYVQPPVPAGAKARVAIQCFSVPSVYSLDSDLPIPDHLVVIVKELILYYAYGRDTESVPARQYSEAHWKAGVGLLKAERETSAVQMVTAEVPAAKPV